MTGSLATAKVLVNWDCVSRVRTGEDSPLISEV
jgi:hypothetical protein